MQSTQLDKLVVQSMQLDKLAEWYIVGESVLPGDPNRHIHRSIRYTLRSIRHTLKSIWCNEYKSGARLPIHAHLPIRDHLPVCKTRKNPMNYSIPKKDLIRIDVESARTSREMMTSGREMITFMRKDAKAFRHILTDKKDALRNHLVYGGKGMGKTVFIQQCAKVIETDDTLLEQYVPILIRLEQDKITRPEDFWRKCLDELANWAWCNGLKALTSHIDREMENKTPNENQSPQEQFESHLLKIGKRPVILVDNINHALNSLESEDRKTLRKQIETNPCKPIVIATCSSDYRHDIESPNGNFFGFIGTSHIEPFSLDETYTLMDFTDEYENNDTVNGMSHMFPILSRLFTGNPMLMLVARKEFQQGSTDNVMTVLKHVCNRMSLYFESTIENLSLHEREIIDATAFSQKPSRTEEISRATGIKNEFLWSSAVNLCNRTGILGGALTPEGYAAHQIKDRFFNIWYNLHYGERRHERRIESMVDLMYAVEYINKAKNLLSNSSENTQKNILIEAARHLHDKDFNKAQKEIALFSNENTITSHTVSALVNLVSQASCEGITADLLRIFEETEIAAQFTPVYIALKIIHGDNQLLLNDQGPEFREMAEKLISCIREQSEILPPDTSAAQNVSPDS